MPYDVISAVFGGLKEVPAGSLFQAAVFLVAMMGLAAIVTREWKSDDGSKVLAAAGYASIVAVGVIASL